MTQLTRTVERAASSVVIAPPCFILYSTTVPAEVPRAMMSGGSLSPFFFFFLVEEGEGHQARAVISADRWDDGLYWCWISELEFHIVSRPSGVVTASLDPSGLNRFILSILLS